VEIIGEPPPKLTDQAVIARVVALLRGEIDPTFRELGNDDEPTTLYRIYDGSKRLLYIGITGRRSLERFHEHDDENHWWREARTIRLTHYSTRREALEAELFAIQAERPKYNILGSNGDGGR